jgi:hypothetical protein
VHHKPYAELTGYHQASADHYIALLPTTKERQCVLDAEVFSQNDSLSFDSVGEPCRQTIKKISGRT